MLLQVKPILFGTTCFHRSRHRSRTAPFAGSAATGMYTRGRTGAGRFLPMYVEYGVDSCSLETNAMNRSNSDGKNVRSSRAAGADRRRELTVRAVVELVPVDGVALRAQAHADAELGAVDGVLVDPGVLRLEKSDTGVLHVVDLVV